MSEPNYAGNIIVILANLPEFLRTPILKKRMLEFFSMSESDKREIINNALEAGPTIPFPNFSKLFKTWLEVLTTITEEQRGLMFSKYIDEIGSAPQKLINFNLDGIFEIFLSLDSSKKEILTNSINRIISNLDENRKKKIFLIIPENAKKHLGF
ncbi:MAG: hypothetical protein XU09_C0004G0048 [Thaumarchaeota archaeon CSP1-1]|nr:MAG: hypothetical protein XU09_C0004G0048 [Thaumarchaeota archaeon CSP1-1]